MNEELTREEMDKTMGGEKPAEEPKATPGEGEPGGDAEPTPKAKDDALVVEKPAETPPKEGEGEEPKPTDGKGKSGEPKDDSEQGRKAKEGTPKGVQKKIDKEVKRRASAEKRADFAEGKVDTLEKQLKEVKEAPLPELVAPNPDDFDDHDKYTDALVDHKLDVRERDKAEKAKVLDEVVPDAKPEEPTPLTEEQEESREAMVDSLEESREKHEDFDEVAFAKDDEGRDTFPVTEYMMEGLESSKSKMEILYYLGQNKKEAFAIAKLPPIKQVMAIGQLDSKIKSPATKKIKTPGAPAPIVPAGGTGTSTPLDMDKLSTDEWMKQRNKQTGQGGQ